MLRWSASPWRDLTGTMRNPGAFLAVLITAVMAIIFSEFALERPIAVLLARDGQS